MPYPDPPGPRIAYDINGSIGLAYLNDGVVHDIHPAALTAMNSERTSGLYWAAPDMSMTSTTNPGLWVAIMFPVAMRIAGIWNRWDRAGSANAVTSRVMGSTDSTNGSDGEWHLLTNVPAGTQATADFTGTAVEGVTGVPRNMSTRALVNDVYRRTMAEGGPIPLGGSSARQLRAIRIEQVGAFSGSTGGNTGYVTHHMHLYGEPDTTASDQRLAFWQTSVDEIVTARWFDWGDVPVASSADKTFRIKNVSSTKTATDIVIDAVAGASGATLVPSPDGQMLFSMDGGVTWTATLTIASLSPGATSGTLRVRRTTPADAALSNWAPRITAEALSWA